MLRRLFPLLFVSVASIVAIALLQAKLNSDRNTEHNRRLTQAHEGVVAQFYQSMDRFSTLMSGLRSYLHYANDFPSQQELQDFLNYQLDQLRFRDSLVVSFIDTTHTFIYSFSPNALDPGHLIGQSVYQLRDTAELGRLDQLLTADEFRVFPPINLVEGWIGIPLNFSVIREGKAVGYIASLVNFKRIMEPIDNLVDSDDFVMKFEVADAYEFDREQVFDSSRVYHSRIDSLSARYARIDGTEWITTKARVFDRDFSISTAYRNKNSNNPYSNWVFGFLYCLVLAFSGWSIYKTRQTTLLNKLLAHLNKTMVQQNQELQDLNKTKDQLFSIIGHDLRGPLGTIIMMMELAEREAISAEDTNELLAKLRPAANNTIHLLEDLLKWAQINNQDIQFSPSPTKIAPIITSNVGLLLPNAEIKGIDIVTKIDTSKDVNLDSNMISTVIRNLIGNAIKFSNDGSEILIHAYHTKDELIISVRDHGIGMYDDQGSALDASMPISRPGTSGEPGTGLGLTICRAFIEQHNGQLEVSSKKDLGSEFKVILPLG